MFKGNYLLQSGEDPSAATEIDVRSRRGDDLLKRGERRRFFLCSFAPISALVVVPDTKQLQVKSSLSDGEELAGGKLTHRR